MTFFSKMFIKTPYSHAHIWSKNVNSVKTTLFYGHKSHYVGCPFCSAFSRKNHCSHENILSKIRIFSKKHTALMPILVKKTSILSKTQCSHVLFFFIFFMKNSCCRANDWSKNVNFVKTTLYFGPKKS